MVQPKYHVFVCTSCRPNGTQKGYCFQKGSVGILQKFVEMVDELELSSDCMITNTGCFGICEKGPIAVVYPEGIWYGNLTDEAVEEICEQHLEGGNPVEKYMI